MVQAVRSATGEIDILVNNVGSTEASSGNTDWFDISPEYWIATLENNLISAIRMIHAFVPDMRQAGWGRLINISSACATRPTLGAQDYCAAKAAMANMTVGLSKILARTATGTARTLASRRCDGDSGLSTSILSTRRRSSTRGLNED